MKHIVLQTFVLALAGVFVVNNVSGQGKKKTDRIIIIENGDTTVNGKLLKKIDKTERDRLKREFKDIDDRFRADVFIERSGPEGDVLVRSFKALPGDTAFIQKFDKHIPLVRRRFRDSLMLSFNPDSLVDRLRSSPDFMAVLPPGDKSVRIPNAYRNHEFSGRPFIMEKAMPNTQVFSFNNTDKDGFTTRMNIAIGAPSERELKSVSGLEEIINPLVVDDLTVFPNFSSGKMTLSFNLTGDRSAVSVKITNSEGKELLSDKVSNFSGTYLKQFNMPTNGIYYILINQSGKSIVKKVVKE